MSCFQSYMILLVFIFSPMAFAKPGGEMLIERKVIDVTLYLVEVYRDSTGKTDAKFGLIPDRSVSGCLSKSWKYCRAFDNCLQYPRAQKCGPKLSNCKEVIRDECRVYENAINNKSTLWSNLTSKLTWKGPSRPLTEVPYNLSDQVKKIVTKWNLASNPLILKIDKIKNEYSIRAKVVWELWSNGERFKILSFND